MNPLRYSSEPSLRVEAGPSSNKRLPFLPQEIIGEIFSWLTPRDRLSLYQNLAEKQIDLISQLRQPRNRDLKTTSDLYATTILKKAVELADQHDWKPYEGFIDELVNTIRKIEETPLKEELSSFLTSLTELNTNQARFYEKHADFFVAFFNLTPPAFDELSRYFGEDHPFIKEATTYRYFEPIAPQLVDPTFLTENKTFINLADTDHFFPIHKILPLLAPGPQSYYALLMICACFHNTMTGGHEDDPLEERYREELIFFAKTISDIVRVHRPIESANLLECLTLAFISLIYHGYIDEVRELAAPLSNPDNPVEEAFWEGVQACIFTYDRKNKPENILLLAGPLILAHKDKLCEAINKLNTSTSRRKRLLAKIEEMHTVYSFIALLHKSP